MTPSPAEKATVPGFFRKLEKPFFVAVLSLVGIVLVVFSLAFWRGWTNPARSGGSGDYEGRIVDRWADTGGEAESYRPRLALVIESNDGRRFTVKVDPTVYESARVGMRIRRKSGQVVLIESPQNPVNK